MRILSAWRQDRVVLIAFKRIHITLHPRIWDLGLTREPGELWAGCGFFSIHLDWGSHTGACPLDSDETPTT